MTVTINLSHEIETKLRERAARSGKSFESFVQELVERAASTPTESGPPGGEPLPSDVALAPFRREVKESGMTDQELLGLFEEARDEAYQEKQGRCR